MDLKILKAASITDISEQYKHALQTAHYTLEYERFNKIVEVVVKDEDIRKLKCRLLLLQDETDTLNDQLANEEECSDHLQQQLDLAEGQIEELEAIVQALENDLRIKSREYENTLAELAAVQSMSNDSTKILTEKLALAREVAILKPEVESLRVQVETNKSVLADKLALQRQLTTVQVELENAQRSAQRAMAKSGTRNEDQSEWDLQIDDLQKKLREAKLARREAEGELEQMKHDLESEKKSANKSKSKKASQDTDLAELDGKLKSLASDLVKSKEEAKQWKEKATELAESKTSDKSRAQDEEAITSLKKQMEGLNKDLATEKRERQKAEKALQKGQTTWEAQKSLLDDKLDQFRTKLRSTKERLKDAEEQLEQAQTVAIEPKPTKPTKVSKQQEKPRAAGRKRAAPPDETVMGTPGDKPQAKRGKRATSKARTIPGDKSTFSITPFLNRTTMSIAPDTPPADDTKQINEQAEQTEQIPIPEDSPVAIAAAKFKKDVPLPKMKPLPSAASSKHNSKSIGRKMSSLPSLQEVAEESSEIVADPQPSKTINLTTFPTEMTVNMTKQTISTDNESGDPQKPVEKQQNQAQPVPKLKATANKPRKSLMAFTSYTDEPAAEKRKKRKLGNGPPKTLFDEEEDQLPAKPIPGRGVFAARALNKANGVKKLGANTSLLMTTGDGFQFSPLKKERRGIGSTFLE